MKSDNAKIISKLYFELLPTQVLLLALAALSGIISTVFASNVIGPIAVSAMGVYNPVYMFLLAISTVILGGAQILCGKFMGRHESKKMQAVFSLDILLILIFSVVITVLMFFAGRFDLATFLASDATVRHEFNSYIMGLSAGVIPFLVSQQLFAFLSLEQQNKRLMSASIVFLVATVIFTYLFIVVLPLGTLGLGLAGAAGNWAFLIALLPYFFRKDSLYQIHFRHVDFSFTREMLKTGLPGALLRIYQAVRGLLVNTMILRFVGSDGLSAYGAAGSLLEVCWALPFGMEIVCRMLFSVSIGEEDKRSLTDIMKTFLLKGLPITCIMAAVVIALAVPITNIFYHDPSQQVYQLTVLAFRILPIAFPFSTICLSFNSFAESFGKHALAHVVTVLDGILCVSVLGFLLIRPFGMTGFYVAYFVSSIICALVFLIYSLIKNKRIPKNMEELMAIPKEFGADVKDRLELSVQNAEDVVHVAETVQTFCKDHGVDAKKAYYAALCMEEMAGNIVDHGFTKDKKKHKTDIRVTYKEDGLILRIKDDCKPFDPAERKNLIDPDDPCKNIGIRMVYKIADDIDYQNMLGLNVLTMKISLA